MPLETISHSAPDFDVSQVSILIANEDVMFTLHDCCDEAHSSNGKSLFIDLFGRVRERHVGVSLLCCHGVVLCCVVLCRVVLCCVVLC